MRRYNAVTNEGVAGRAMPATVSEMGCSYLSDGNGGFMPCPELLTEEELIRFLRIPEISKASDYRNVVENLKRMHDLPRIHICGRPLYPLDAIRQWIRERTTNAR